MKVDIKISVIVPTYQDDTALSSLLRKLANMNIDEIIISDGENRPKLPGHIYTNGMTIIHLYSSLGRGPQIKAGINISQHPLIWILHADNQPHDDAPNHIRKYLEEPGLSLLKFTLGFNQPSWGLKLFSWFARWDSPISTFGDQGYAFRRMDYDALDLDLDDYTLLEDVALRHALKTKGRVKRSPLKIMTSARRFEKRGVWRTQFLNLYILWRHFRGQSPASLYKLYYDL